MADGEAVQIAQALERARALVTEAQDAAAQQAYVDILRRAPSNFHALNELGNLAFAGGFRSAARTAYLEAVKYHPDNQIARINLGNLLREEKDEAGAEQQYQAALAIDPEMHEAHQGMAWVLRESDRDRAEWHWQKGYSGRAIVTKPYRGTGSGIPLLMLVSARGGNIPTQLWIDDKRFATSAIYSEFYDFGSPLPPHSLVVNAIGDADLCAVALSNARRMLRHTAAPVINHPARVELTGRAEIAHRLSAIAGVITPRIATLRPSAILEADDLRFPLLLRRPGFHTGEHFAFVAARAELPQAIASLGGEELLVISYLDARGADGMSRKYRVMFIDGIVYPLHLAISADWKVHYFSSAMAQNASFREEERRFLKDMSAVLGTRAMQALHGICSTLGLDYAGVDFALSPEGSVLLFEANATMVVFPPGPEQMWDYRRQAISEVLTAATQMLIERAQMG